MIITRTPFRVSFIGGGSDLKSFYFKNGYGAVVSTAICQYMYIVIHPYFHKKIRIKYSKTEDVVSIDEIKHPIVRECLKKVKLDKGIEIASFADVPAGTGLGSSSAFTVGLLHALYAHKGAVISKERLAEEACEIEIKILKEPIGKQDQYAAAFGNINHITFNKNESVEVEPIILTEAAKEKIEKEFCLYYTGKTRKTKNILSKQKANMQKEKQFNFLSDMVKLVIPFKESLLNGDQKSIADILHTGWTLKKELASGISNNPIENLYNKAKKYGCRGGKLLGAGGGGFLLLYAKNHNILQQNLDCKLLPIKIDTEGSKILFQE